MKLLLLSALLAITSSVSYAQATDVQTARGTVSIAEKPERVAVFDMAALDTLASIGVKPVGVPEKVYLETLEPLKHGAEIVGNIFEPDLEALSSLDPDLIILGGRSSTKVDQTAAIAPTIDMTMLGDDLVAQAKERLATYGALFGKQEEAQRVSADLDELVRAAQQAVKGKGKALIVMTNGPKVTAYGPGSRFGWVHATLNLEAAVPDIKAANHGEAVSFEFINKANPDWLLVLDRASAIGSGEQGAKTTLDNELVAQTTAWKKGQVIYLPAPEFYIAAGGVQSTGKVLQVITDAFNAAK